jgi:hypothetical protein
VGAGVLIVVGVTVAAAVLLSMLRSTNPASPGGTAIDPPEPSPIGDGELVPAGSERH